MGLYVIQCPQCGQPHCWFSGNLDQRCRTCRAEDLPKAAPQDQMSHLFNGPSIPPWPRDPLDPTAKPSTEPWPRDPLDPSRKTNHDDFVQPQHDPPSKADPKVEQLESEIDKLRSNERWLNNLLDTYTRQKERDRHLIADLRNCVKVNCEVIQLRDKRIADLEGALKARDWMEIERLLNVTNSHAPVKKGAFKATCFRCGKVCDVDQPVSGVFFCDYGCT